MCISPIDEFLTSQEVCQKIMKYIKIYVLIKDGFHSGGKAQYVYPNQKLAECFGLKWQHDRISFPHGLYLLYDKHNHFLIE